MRIRIFDSPRDAARALARDVARTIARNPQTVFGLPTGRTPIPLYRELIVMHRAGRLDFSRVSTFNLDEFLGVDAASSTSYRAFMNRHLFDHVNMRARGIHFLDGSPADPAAECVRFDRAIERAGGIDVMILGLGANGHIGFNEPARSLAARTHRTRLKPSTRRANARLFKGRVGDVPRQALSMGMATILRSRRIVLLVTGRSKARCLARVVYGRVTTRVPASFLQLHGNVEVWADRAAASALYRTGSSD